MEENKEYKERQNRIVYETEDFLSNIVPFGYLDIKRAVEVYSECGKYGYELADDVKEFADEVGYKLEDLDIVYIAYDTILNETRDKLVEMLEWDFMNQGTGDIYAAGNYLATSYDQTENLINEINKELKKLDKQELEDTLKEFEEDKVLRWFLNEIEFQLNLEDKNE